MHVSPAIWKSKITGYLSAVHKLTSKRYFILVHSLHENAQKRFPVVKNEKCLKVLLKK